MNSWDPQTKPLDACVGAKRKKIMSMLRLVTLTIVLLTAAGHCNASMFRINDLGDTISITMGGVPLKGNGGRITNFILRDESVAFDISTALKAPRTLNAFTKLFEQSMPSCPSDIILFRETKGDMKYHIVFGSDPLLPNIPPDAIDLTTQTSQGLPPSPIIEDGTEQKVLTTFPSPFGTDTYYVQSDTGSDSDVACPEPASVFLLGTGFLGFFGLCRRRSTVMCTGS
jgi:hypothetical protein